MSDPSPEQSFLAHAALAQAHRWFLVYEHPEATLDNAVDLLMPDVHIQSVGREGTGHATYRAGVEALPRTWRNAHRVTDAQVDVATDGTISLEMDVAYQNVGIDDGGAVVTRDLHYTTVLVPSNAALDSHVSGEAARACLLPRFRRIAISPVGEGTAATFEPAYAENRLKSLVHRWLSLVEDPARDPEPFFDLLARDFALHFSADLVVTDADGFRAWMAGPVSSVEVSTHAVEAFEAHHDGGNDYHLTTELEWRGRSTDGPWLDGRTHHTWAVADDPAERFARIHRMDVRWLRPLAPTAL